MTWPTHDGETQADHQDYLDHEALMDYYRTRAIDERHAWEQEQMDRWADEAVGDESFEDLRRRVDEGHYDDVIEDADLDDATRAYFEPITKTGRVLTDAEIEALADEAEAGYDLGP